MANPRYGAIKAKTIPRMSAGLYLGFIGCQYNGPTLNYMRTLL